MQHDGTILLDLGEKLVGVEQLCQYPCSFVHHIQFLCLLLDLGNISSDRWYPTRFFQVLIANVCSTEGGGIGQLTHIHKFEELVQPLA